MDVNLAQRLEGFIGEALRKYSYKEVRFRAECKRGKCYIYAEGPLGSFSSPSIPHGKIRDALDTESNGDRYALEQLVTEMARTAGAQRAVQP